MLLAQRQLHRHRIQSSKGNPHVRELDNLVDGVKKQTHYMERSEADL